MLKCYILYSLVEFDNLTDFFSIIFMNFLNLNIFKKKYLEKKGENENKSYD